MLYFILITLTAITAQANIDAACEGRFVGLMNQRPQGHIAAPERISIPLTETEVTRAFDLAREALNKRVNLQRLGRTLSRIEADPLSADDFLASLKEARKFANVLKSHYLLLSAQHRPPAQFDQFQKLLGELSDAIANRANKKEIRELAQKVRNLAAEVPASLDQAGFRPASLGSLRSRLDSIRDSIAEVTGEQLPTPRALHLARNAVKQLLAYHLSLEALEPGSGKRQAYDFLFRLNEEMGGLHDNFITQSRAGEIDYERQRFFPNPILQAKLRQLEAALAAD